MAMTWIKSWCGAGENAARVEQDPHTEPSSFHCNQPCAETPRTQMVFYTNLSDPRAPITVRPPPNTRGAQQERVIAGDPTKAVIPPMKDGKQPATSP